MAGSLKDDDGMIAEINITPFVDVALVLLVIFMVTAGFIVNRGVKISLPQAAQTDQLERQKTFNILVGKDGQIMLDGKIISGPDLKTAGQQAKATGQKVVALISADKGVVYAAVVGVMDTLRQAGVNDFALQLEQLPTKGAP